MAHHPTAVSRVKDPTKGFAVSIRWIQDTRDVVETDIAAFFPGLDTKGWNINVTNAFSWVTGINDFDTSFIIFVDGSRRIHGELEITEYRTKGKDCFGSRYSCKEFSFGGAEGGDRLGFGAVGDGATSKGENVASGITTLAKVVGVSCIHKAGELGMVDGRKVLELFR